MSTTFLVVIPRDPQTPLPETAADVKAQLSKLAGTDEARVKDYGKLQFIDCGGAFEQISCPNCDCVLGTSQWHEFMNSDWHEEDGFHLHDHEMPCCGAPHSLDQLDYDAPQGFARWIVSSRAANRGALTQRELVSLEAIAGMPLRPIIQQY